MRSAGAEATRVTTTVDRTFCVDSRRPRYASHPTVGPQLFPAGGIDCDCSSPVELKLDLEGADNAIGLHCKEAGEFEKEAESRRGACGSRRVFKGARMEV